MKYIMLQTAEGAKLPVLFPETLVHSDVADVMGRLVDISRGSKALGRKRTRVASAGFVGIEGKLTVSGKSESLGDIQSNPLDSARIMAGASVEYMPDGMLSPIAYRIANPPDALLDAARMVEDWWLAEGMKHFPGAPACIFALRQALKERS